MDKYKVININYQNAPNLEYYLNELASQGYEFVQYITTKGPISNHMILMEKKREVVEFKLSPFCTRVQTQPPE